MPARSLDLRERIPTCCDAREGTRPQIADRFQVSSGFVKKLLAQRARTKKPGLTLREPRDGAGLRCSLPSVHRTLAKMGQTCKKRRSAPAGRTDPTSPAPGGHGGASSGAEASTRPGSSSWTRAEPRPT